MSDLPFPGPAAKKPKFPELAKPKGPDVPTVGGFFAEHRALVDGRKQHLARVGMIPEHVNALRMPDLDDRPQAPAVHTESLPDANMAGGDYEAPKLPKLPGVNATLADADEE